MSRSHHLVARANRLINKNAYQDARVLLRVALREDGKNEAAWLSFLETCQRRSEKKRVLDSWIRNNPESHTARQLYNEFDTVHYSLINRQSWQHWSLDRASTITLSTAILMIFMLIVWLFGTQQPVLSAPEATPAPFLSQAEHLIQSLTADLQQLRGEVGHLAAVNRSLQMTTDQLRAENTQLTNENAIYKQNEAALAHNQEILQAELSSLNDALAQAQMVQVQQTAVIAQTNNPPYAIIANDEIKIVAQLRSGNMTELTMPYANYHAIAGHIQQSKTYQAHINLKTGANMSGPAMDFRPFIRPDMVAPITNHVATYHVDKRQLMSELCHIVSQLEQTSANINNTPSYPLETIIRGSGDVEDKAILLASLLAAYDQWEVGLVYIDKQHPTQRHAPNHLLVRVTFDGKDYYLDPSSSIMEPYDNALDSTWDFTVPSMRAAN